MHRLRLRAGAGAGATPCGYLARGTIVRLLERVAITRRPAAAAAAAPQPAPQRRHLAVRGGRAAASCLAAALTRICLGSACSCHELLRA
jgi:hypothetical protein